MPPPRHGARITQTDEELAEEAAAGNSGAKIAYFFVSLRGPFSLRIADDELYSVFCPLALHLTIS